MAFVEVDGMGSLIQFVSIFSVDVVIGVRFNLGEDFDFTGVSRS